MSDQDCKVQSSQLTLVVASLHNSGIQKKSQGTTVHGQMPISYSPDFEIFYYLLHVLQLSLHPAPLCGDGIQLPSQVIDIGLKQGLQALPHCSGTLLLQEVPLGLQDLVLLLQEPHLEGSR